MHYNIVSIRNRWKSSGILDEFETIKEQVQMARYLETAMEILIPMDGDDELELPNLDPFRINITNQAGDLIILVVMKLYKRITSGGFERYEVDKKLLAENLKMDGHKIDIQDLVDMSLVLINQKRHDISDVMAQLELDADIRDEIVFEYLKKYGTGE